MATISKERLREMEKEMDRFEAEIQGVPAQPLLLIASSTYEKVQAQLTTIRQESTRLQQRQKTEKVEDEDLRFAAGQRKRRAHDPDDNQYHDIDERPGRPQGPLIPPPPPPPVILRPQAPMVFAPPPPPPPPPEEPGSGDSEGIQSTLSFTPYGPGETPAILRPAFMPPQLRHRAPVPGMRPPFPRPPVRIGIPPSQFGGPMGFPQPPHMMGPISSLPSVGVTMPPGVVAGPPSAPGTDSNTVQFMTPSLEAASVEVKPKPAVVEQPKVIYAAGPVLTVEIKKEDKKKKKKKKKKIQAAANEDNKGTNDKDSGGTKPHTNSSVDEDKSVMDMEIVPESALVGGIMSSNIDATTDLLNTGINIQNATPTGKKEKKKKEKKFLRLAANTTWEDPTLAEWQQDDFRMFCGDLGNEVTDETLVRAFNKYPSFLKAKVIRDRRTNKTKGYGFISFKDPLDFARAMREMNGKYVGNRPIKLRKSSWRDRNLEVVRRKEKEKKRLGLK